MMEIDQSLQRALKIADAEVRKLGRTDISPLFLLVGILLEGNTASARIFFENQVDDNNGTKRTITLGLWDTAGQVKLVKSSLIRKF